MDLTVRPTRGFDCTCFHAKVRFCSNRVSLERLVILGACACARAPSPFHRRIHLTSPRDGGMNANETEKITSNSERTPTASNENLLPACQQSKGLLFARPTAGAVPARPRIQERARTCPARRALASVTLSSNMEWLARRAASA